MYLYNKSVWKYIYIISMALAYTTKYADIFLGFGLQLVIGLSWILLAVFKLEKNRGIVAGVNRQDLLFYVKIYFVPKLIIHMYTILLMIFGKVDWNIFSTNLTVYVPTLLVIVSIYLFGTKALVYNCYALIISWILSVGVSFICKGPYMFVFAIKQAYFGYVDINYSNYLELHDLVLALGYIVIYYYISNKGKMTKKAMIILTSVLLIMLLGFKRIAILGVVGVMLLSFLLNRIGERKRYKICIAFGCIGIALCYGFIFIMSQGTSFFEMLNKIGINPMGRNYYYMAIMKYAEFDVGFWGIGRNAVTHILNTELAYLRVGGVHSDIIKMYVENGFIMFGLWLWFNLIKIPQLIKKRFSVKAAIVYFMITVYTFTLYLTDNVEIYFICQILSMIIPMTYIQKEKEIERAKQ